MNALYIFNFTSNPDTSLIIFIVIMVIVVMIGLQIDKSGKLENAK